MLIIPEEPKQEETGNRKHRRMLESRQRHVEQHNKKMKAFFTKIAQKRARVNAENQKKFNETLQSSAKDIGAKPE